MPTTPLRLAALADLDDDRPARSFCAGVALPWVPGMETFVPASIAARYEPDVLATCGHLASAVAAHAVGQDLTPAGLGMGVLAFGPDAMPLGVVGGLRWRSVTAGDQTSPLHDPRCRLAPKRSLEVTATLVELAGCQRCRRCGAAVLVSPMTAEVWERVWDMAALAQLADDATSSLGIDWSVEVPGAVPFWVPEGPRVPEHETMAQDALAAGRVLLQLAARVALGDDLADWARPWLADGALKLARFLQREWAGDPAVDEAVVGALDVLDAVRDVLGPAGWL